MPRGRSGTSVPPVVALLALSAATIASSLPCPNRSGWAERVLAAVEAGMGGTVPPEPLGRGRRVRSRGVGGDGRDRRADARQDPDRDADGGGPQHGPAVDGVV